MNPCSVESIPEGVRLDNRTTEASVWPVLVNCYELQDDGSRAGRMDLFLINGDYKLGEKQTIETGTCGILDGKWMKRENGEFWFASALSTGQVRIDSFSFHESAENNVERAYTRHVATSKVLQDEPALCLSLSWDTTRCGEEQPRIVSSYSNGKVAIHDVVHTNDTVQLVECQSWLAHTLFGNTPAEVWCTCFATNENNERIVLTGGDDCKLKLWDLRSTSQPVQVLNHFQAGVTILSPNPKRPHIVAVGSYDETIAIHDVRSASKPLTHSSSLGGGIWRIKWHPEIDNRLLVAAMHGGCRVVDLKGDEHGPDFHVTMEFTKHESMAYGADWILANGDEEDDDDGFEAAISCSFYDRAIYLWRTR